MAKKRRVWKYLLIGLGIHCIVSILWAVALELTPPPRFVGSPPRAYASQRNALDFSQQGAWWGKFIKRFRPHGYLDFSTPAGLFTPLAHHFGGWDVYDPDRCVTGKVAYMGVSDDDGDIGYGIDPDAADIAVTVRPGHPVDADAHRRLTVEIDHWLRGNFPVIYDLAVGDRVLVCGTWVYDRGHDHMELHPIRWLEIMPP